MNLKASYKPTFSFLILMVFSSVVYGQEITLIDFGDPAQLTSGNWNNLLGQNVPGTFINLIDNTGATTGEVLTLTDVFDLSYANNNQGTLAAGVSFDGLPLPRTASRDSFFGEDTTFSGSLQPTGGFTLSNLEAGKYYSFTIFASRMGVTDNRETLYTITGNTTDTDTLDPANNINNTATISNIQPNSSGEITIQAETGPNNTNTYGFYYIGAIEMTKVSCLSTITWDGTAWSNVVGPDLTTEVELNANYNTATSSIGSFSACSLIVKNNSTLTVNDNTYIEIQNDITVDDAGSSIIVQPQGSVIQLDDLGTVINNGTITVNKQTAPANAWYEYTYWSSPVFGETIGGGLFDSQADRRFLFNAQNFLDATAETGNDNGTAVGQDDIDDNNNDWQSVSGATVMTPGVGYASTHDETVFNFSPGSPKQFIYSFNGRFNNGVITVPIYRNDSESLDYNWNFVGNPYPSAIDADLFLAANSSVATDVAGTSYTDGAIFLWSQNTAPSGTANGNQVFNFSNDDYAIINAVGQNAGGDGVMPTRHIPSGQGFFVSMSNIAPATLISGSVYTTNVTFNNSMRVKGINDNSQFFKSSNTKKTSKNVDNKLWLNLTSDNGVFNQILVGYVNGATNNDDGISYDTNKYPTKGAALYSTIENSNKKFAVQGKAVSSLNEEEAINLGFSTYIDVATLYTLSIEQLQGEFLANSPIYLKDNLLNKTHDLSAYDYTFTSEVGEFNSRFQIGFNAQALSADEFDLDESKLSIVELENDIIKFTVSNNSSIKSVTIFDILGRQLYNLKGQRSTETYKLSKLNSSIFIAKVALSNGAIITKKAIKK